MHVQSDSLVSLETLCARMRFLLDHFGRSGAIEGEPWWPGTANLLYPAACLSGLETDASVADLYGAWAYCAPAAAYDERQSLMLDDYMSALARYHFVWNAYEWARGRCAAGRLMTGKNASQRKTLASMVLATQLELVDRIYIACLPLAQENKTIRNRLNNIKGEELGVGKAAVLAGTFRNYLFHGHEEPPEPDDWDVRFQKAPDGAGAVSLKSYRMVSLTRLTLHLVQTLMHAELRPRHEIEVCDLPFLRAGPDYEFELPCDLALNLTSFWPEDRSLRLSESAIRYLAKGSNLSGDVLDLLMEVAREAV